MIVPEIMMSKKRGMERERKRKKCWKVLWMNEQNRTEAKRERGTNESENRELSLHAG